MLTKKTLQSIIVYESIWFLPNDLTTEEGKKDLQDSAERIIFTYGRTRISELFGIKKEEVDNAVMNLLTISKANFTSKKQQ